MPYLPVELDALNKFPHVARAAGVDQSRISDGMLYLWAHCFRGKTDRVTVTHIKGFFGQDVSEALVAFAFLEAGEGDFRVRGAKDKLFGRGDGQRKGGLAAKGNLIPGGPKRGKPKAEPSVSPAPAESADLGSAETPAESQPSQPSRLELGLSSALTPNTQHPTPNTKEEEAPASDPLRALGALNVPSVMAGAQPERRASPRVALIFEKPTSPPGHWLGPDFYAWFQWLRQESGLPAEDRPQPVDLSAWWSACLMTPGVDAQALKRAAQLYGKSDYWEPRGFPFLGFMRTWSDWVAKEKSRATG